jgi:hypothetical protein
LSYWLVMLTRFSRQENSCPWKLEYCCDGADDPAIS